MSSLSWRVKSRHFRSLGHSEVGPALKKHAHTHTDTRVHTCAHTSLYTPIHVLHACLMCRRKGMERFSIWKRRLLRDASESSPRRCYRLWLITCFGITQEKTGERDRRERGINNNNNNNDNNNKFHTVCGTNALRYAPILIFT